jgi:hypothetical protein
LSQKNVPTMAQVHHHEPKLGFGGRISRSGPSSAFKCSYKVRRLNQHLPIAPYCPAMSTQLAPWPRGVGYRKLAVQRRRG